jgi:hypothetical protein
MEMRIEPRVTHGRFLPGPASFFNTHPEYDLADLVT